MAQPPVQAVFYGKCHLITVAHNITYRQQVAGFKRMCKAGKMVSKSENVNMILMM